MAKAPKTEETAMTAPEQNTSLVIHDYGDDAGKGYENQTKADMSIPFINQLQALSPLVATEKARPGDYFNTVTEEIIPRDKGFLFVAGGTRRAFAEWVPRNNPDGSERPAPAGGGGYRGEHAVDSAIVARATKESVKFGKFFTPDGNVLRDTFYVYGCLCGEDGTNTMAIMPFWSTKIKPYRAWQTRLRQFTIKDETGVTILGPDGKPARPPLYGHLNRITSVQTQNTNKQMYYVPVITSADPRGLQWSLLAKTDERFQMAKECKMLFESGAAEVDYSKQDTAGDDGGGGGEDDSTTGSPFGT